MFCLHHMLAKDSPQPPLWIKCYKAGERREGQLTFTLSRSLEVQTRATRPLYARGMNFGPRVFLEPGECHGPGLCVVATGRVLLADRVGRVSRVAHDRGTCSRC